MSGFRLPEPHGTRIDRTRPISFLFNGKVLSGFRGDTLASALLANGVRLVGRGYKLHRPRGVFGAGFEEPNAIVDLVDGDRRTPDVRATTLELTEGLAAESVNCWPSVGFDVGALVGVFAPLLPAGFYYKTFMWPDWHWFEPAIRWMAGLGRTSLAPDRDRYEEISIDADVAVAGGGIAGLSAAVAAAEAGADTTLLCAGPVVGGALGWRGDASVRALLEKAGRAGVRLLTRTVGFGVYDHGLLCASQSLAPATPGTPGMLRERLWKIRARSIVAAQGAFERPMLFPGNDRPGVMLAGAAEKYAHAQATACGRRVVIAANADSAYAVARSLRAAGLEIVAVVDRRPPALIGAHADGVRCIAGHGIRQVIGRRGVRGCVVVDADAPGDRGERLDCDLILSAGGFAPAVHLHSQAKGRLRWLDEEAMFVPDGAAPGLHSVGACAGVFARSAAIEHATEVGRSLALGFTVPPPPVGGAGRSLASSRIPGVRGKIFLDLQNDVAVSDVALAATENYRSVEHLKRYTTTGMATDQGKTSNVNALVLMGEATQRAPAEVGTTTFRPPFAPVSFGAIVGQRVADRYRPQKRLPAADWHVGQGALFEWYGNWTRPAAYPRADESLESAAQREAETVRGAVGVFDGSPLGKIEVWGPDAAEFLDLMYVGTMSTLAPGQARYGLLLNENGVIVDDGVVARLSPGHFWVNTTSAGAERTAAAFEEWLQCEYPNLRALVTPVTSCWGNVTVSGPKAWTTLAAIGLDARFAPGAMRHMTIADGTFDGAPVRILRASFTGELSYEINVPVERTRALLERVWAAAAPLGGSPYGIEALEILRTEKGYLHVGVDTDGTTLPGDVGFARGIDRKRANFVGRRSLLRPAALDPGRPRLVGLRSADGRTPLPVGAQIANAPPPTTTEGYVTSSHWSPTLRAPVALAMLARGAERLGETIGVHHLGQRIDALVVTPPFVDPEGKRLHG